MLMVEETFSRSDLSQRCGRNLSLSADEITNMVKRFKTHLLIYFFTNFSDLQVQDIPIYLVLDRSSKIDHRTQINELWSQSNPPKILKYIRGKQTCQTSFWSIILWWISLTFKGWRRHLPTLNTIESTTLQISMQILVLFPFNIFILKDFSYCLYSVN